MARESTTIFDHRKRSKSATFKSPDTVSNSPRVIAFYYNHIPNIVIFLNKNKKEEIPNKSLWNEHTVSLWRILVRINILSVEYLVSSGLLENAHGHAYVCRMSCGLCITRDACPSASQEFNRKSIKVTRQLVVARLYTSAIVKAKLVLSGQLREPTPNQYSGWYSELYRKRSAPTTQ